MTKHEIFKDKETLIKLESFTKLNYEELVLLAKNTANSDYVSGVLSSKNVLICLAHSFKEFLAHFGISKSQSGMYFLMKRIFVSTYINQIGNIKLV